MTRDERVKRAKTQLILRYPFVGNLLFGMDIVWDTSIPTAGTNGEVIVLNPDYVDSLTDEELVFLLAHEVCHPMLGHCFRLETRDSYKWNQAGDYVINHMLDEDGIGKMPDGGLLDRNIYEQGKGNTDGIYNLLPDTPKDEQGMGGEGQPLDDCIGNNNDKQAKTQSDLDRLSAKWKVKVAQSANATKIMGKMTSGIERLVNEVLRPKVDWKEVLLKFMQKLRVDDRTYARPNRRFITQGMYMPSVTGMGLGEIAVAVDCSGSVGQDEINQFNSEINTIWQDLLPSRLHVVYFDSEVSHYDEFNKGDDVVIKPHGGGGTAFSPVFEYLDKKDIQPLACVFLTDLYCSDFGKEPEYPVLWISTTSDDNMRVPFGEIVRMHDNN
jgi:predicted metal-dependent peptidase